MTHCPHASVTNYGARVASQQSPILQAGKNRITELYKNAIESNEYISLKTYHYMLEKMEMSINITFSPVRLFVRQQPDEGKIY